MPSPWDRAWSRRPLATAARWMPARAITAIWAETQVTFKRDKPVETQGGGFSRDPRGTYLVAWCHVELQTNSSPAPGSPDLGLIQPRWWDIYLPIAANDVPLTAAQYPFKGDIVEFTTDYGVAISLPVRFAESPESLLDHWELSTEEYT